MVSLTLVSLTCWPLDARAVGALETPPGVGGRTGALAPVRLRLIVNNRNTDSQSVKKELWFKKKKTAVKVTDFTKKIVESC